MKKELDEELAKLRSQGLSRTLRNRDQSGLINFSSNDYLGLAAHPEVIRAATEALRRFGAGGTASRLLAGTVTPHSELEAALARFLSKEAALVFSSGYHANTGIIPALVSAKDIVFFDRLSHASIIDGVRLSGAPFSAFDHNDAGDLEARLKRQRAKGRRALIITEGIFSMDGDRPPLLELARLAKMWDAWLYVDEAHSLGVVGPEGKGLAAEEGLLSNINVHVGTLSKTLGSQGGFVAGSRPLIDLLISRCRSFAYTTALAPALAAAALAALRLLPRFEKERFDLGKASSEVRRSLKEKGFDCAESSSQIIPVVTGSLEATKALSDHLLSQGFFVPSIRPPTVPAGEGRVRLSISLPVLKNVRALVDAFKGGRLVQAG